jgi:hypothetical protein
MERQDSNVEQSPYTATLHVLRGLLDRRQLGSTAEHRVVSVLEFCMISEVDGTDELTALARYFPHGEDLLLWYKENIMLIDQLRREDKRDYFTDRWDLEEAAKEHTGSTWLMNISEAVKMLPLDPEVANADIAMKLLYIQAHYQFEHAPTPPQAPLTAA